MDAAKLFHLVISNKATLQQLYMPFLVDGGLFLPTMESYTLGDQVFLLLELPDDRECCAVVGKVVWLLPDTAHTQRNPSGVGVQFIESENQLKARIDNLLAGELDNLVSTLTL